MAVADRRTPTGESPLAARGKGGPTASLVEIIPGVDRRLDEEERCPVSRLRVPVHTAFEGPLDLGAELRAARAFAIVIVEGLVVRRLEFGGHIGLQLLGPGDVISRPGDDVSELVSLTGLEARGVVRFATLDDRVLALTQRYPRLLEGLGMSGEEQQQRLLAQLLICQLPRVEDRVQAILWLLAETWGRVTPSGTVLPMRLTHDAIGQLIGSRRSTVTLALRALEDRSALLRRRDDWLLLERPAPATCAEADVALPSLSAPAASSPWSEARPEPARESRAAALAWLRRRRQAIMEESREHIATADAVARRSERLTRRAARGSSAGHRLHHQDGAGDLPIVLDGTDG